MDLKDQPKSTELKEKTKLNYILPSEDTFQLPGRQQLKAKGWKIIIQANDIQRKVGLAIPMSDKIDFKTKN